MAYVSGHWRVTNGRPHWVQGYADSRTDRVETPPTAGVSVPPDPAFFSQVTGQPDPQAAPGTTPQAQAPDPVADYDENGIRAQSFKNWFGDWESRSRDISHVRHEDGEPRIMFPVRGTTLVDEGGEPSVFGQLRSSLPGMHFSSQPSDAPQPAFDPTAIAPEQRHPLIDHATALAQQFQAPAPAPEAQELFMKTGNLNRLYPAADTDAVKQSLFQRAQELQSQPGKAVFLNIRNPFHTDKKLDTQATYALTRNDPPLLHALATTTMQRSGASEGAWPKKAIGQDYLTAMNDLGRAHRIPEGLSSLGHDGIAHTHGDETRYVAFQAPQVKSVANVGTFDPQHPDIYKAVTPDSPYRISHKREYGNFYKVLAHDAEGKEVGVLDWERGYNNPRYADISSIWVHPEHQRQGIGTSLYEALLDRLRRHGVEHVGGEVTSQGVLNLRNRVFGRPSYASDNVRKLGMKEVRSQLPALSPQNEEGNVEDAHKIFVRHKVPAPDIYKAVTLTPTEAHDAYHRNAGWYDHVDDIDFLKRKMDGVKGQWTPDKSRKMGTLVQAKAEQARDEAKQYGYHDHDTRGDMVYHLRQAAHHLAIGPDWHPVRAHQHIIAAHNYANLYNPEAQEQAHQDLEARTRGYTDKQKANYVALGAMVNAISGPNAGKDPRNVTGVAVPVMPSPSHSITLEDALSTDPKLADSFTHSIIENNIKNLNHFVIPMKHRVIANRYYPNPSLQGTGDFKPSTAAYFISPTPELPLHLELRTGTMNQPKASDWFNQATLHQSNENISRHLASLRSALVKHDMTSDGLIGNERGADMATFRKLYNDAAQGKGIAPLVEFLDKIAEPGDTLLRNRWKETRKKMNPEAFDRWYKQFAEAGPDQFDEPMQKAVYLHEKDVEPLGTDRYGANVYHWKPYGVKMAYEPVDVKALDAPLIHVTGNAPAIQEGGVIRAFRGSDKGGLGNGGEQNIPPAVSFTTDPKVAKQIARELVRLGGIARGEITPEQFPDVTAEDEYEAGLNPGSLRGLIHHEGKDHNPDTVLRAYKNYLNRRGSFGGEPDPIIYSDRARDFAHITPETVGEFHIHSSKLPKGAFTREGEDENEVQVHADVPIGAEGEGHTFKPLIKPDPEKEKGKKKLAKAISPEAQQNARAMMGAGVTQEQAVTPKPLLVIVAKATDYPNRPGQLRMDYGGKDKPYASLKTLLPKHVFENAKYEGYAPPDALYHVTTNKDAVMRSGLLSRSDLKAHGIQGLGHPKDEAAGLISTTWDYDRADKIHHTLHTAASLLRGHITPSDAFEKMHQLHGQPENYADVLNAAGVPYNISEHDDPEVLTRYLNRNYKTPERKYDFIKTLDEYLPTADGEYEGGGFHSVGLTAPLESMMKIDPEQVHIFKVKPVMGADPEVEEPEQELRFRPEHLDIDPNE